MVVKTYRGLLVDNEQEKIPLSTKGGGVGYRIVKFQLLGDDPQVHRQESVVKIFKKEQSTVTGLINFNDTSLLGVAVHKNYEAAQYPMGDVVIFDTEIFNRDIFLTHTDEGGSTRACNYYIELEQMKLDQTQNMSATLKAIRGSAVD